MTTGHDTEDEQRYRLHDRTDIQVASGHPEVNEFRAAYLAAIRAGDRVTELRRQLNAPLLLDRIRARLVGEYEAAQRKANDAEARAYAAEVAAVRAAPGAAERVCLSVDAYRARLHREHVTYGDALFGL